MFGLGRSKRTETPSAALSISPQQIRMVQRSWQHCVPIAPKVAELFYGRLFSEYPETRQLFSNPDDMYQQGFKLMMMVTKVAYSLDRLDKMLPLIQESGRKHVAYGVKNSDYDKVANCLLWTLEQGLGKAWNADLKNAWVAAYSILAKAMTDAGDNIR